MAMTCTLLRSLLGLETQNVRLDVALEVQGQTCLVPLNFTVADVQAMAASNGREEWFMVDVAMLASQELGLTVGLSPAALPAPAPPQEPEPEPEPEP